MSSYSSCSKLFYFARFRSVTLATVEEVFDKNLYTVICSSVVYVCIYVHEFIHAYTHTNKHSFFIINIFNPTLTSIYPLVILFGHFF